jgi:hypothetical protein
MSFVGKLLVKNVITAAGVIMPPEPAVQIEGGSGISVAVSDNPTLGATVVLITSSGGNGPSVYGVDTFTLHRWQCNDASTPLLDVGAAAGAANTPLAVQNGAQVNLGDVGLYCDAANFLQDGASGGYAKGVVATGTPVSTTLISLSCWIRPRSFTNAYARPVAKGYNATGVSPYNSIGIVFSTTTGTITGEWASGGAYQAIQLGPSSSSGRGYVWLDQWQHIAVTFSQAAGTATWNYYWNGNLILTNTAASGVLDWGSVGGGSWYVGGEIAAGAIGNATFDGWIFDVRVDDGVARAAGYWKALYQAGVFVHS